jgi:hypothetical protein
MHFPPAYPWASLPKDAVVVDVGGGIGSAALLLAQNHPHLRIIVQDLPEVAANARKVSIECQMKHMLLIRYFRAGKFNSPRSINPVKSPSRVRCLILCTFCPRQHSRTHRARFL